MFGLQGLQKAPKMSEFQPLGRATMTSSDERLCVLSQDKIARSNFASLSCCKYLPVAQSIIADGGDAIGEVSASHIRPVCTSGRLLVFFRCL